MPVGSASGGPAPPIVIIALYVRIGAHRMASKRGWHIWRGTRRRGGFVYCSGLAITWTNYAALITLSGKYANAANEAQRGWNRPISHKDYG
jgi:hypothetical protein